MIFKSRCGWTAKHDGKQWTDGFDGQPEDMTCLFLDGTTTREAHVGDIYNDDGEWLCSIDDDSSQDTIIVRYDASLCNAADMVLSEYPTWNPEGTKLSDVDGHSVMKFTRSVLRGWFPVHMKLTWTNRAGEKLVLGATHLKVHHDFILSGCGWMSATWLTEAAEKLVEAHMGIKHIIHDAQFSHFDGDSTDIDFEDGGNLLVEHIECL